MADIKQFKLPDIGEGLTEADILTWQVAGRRRRRGQPDHRRGRDGQGGRRASLAVRRPRHRRCMSTRARRSTSAPPIISIDVAPGAALPASPPRHGASGATEAGGAAEDLVPLPDVTGRRPARPATSAVSRSWSATGRARRALAAAPPPAAPTATPRRSRADRLRRAAAEPAAGTAAEPVHVAPAHRVLAKPPVRKLAKSLGVDLGEVRPTGPNGTVSRDDVAQAAGEHPDRQLTPCSRRVRRRARRGSRSRASASTPRPRWWPRRSPRRTSPSSSRSTSRATMAAARSRRRPPRVPRRQGVAAAVRRQGGDPRGAADPGDQRDLGRRRRRDRRSSTTSTSASPRPPSAG